MHGLKSGKFSRLYSKAIPMTNIHAKDKTGPSYLELLPANTVWCFEVNDDTASLRAHKATTREHGTYLEELNVSVEVDQTKPELYDRFRMPYNDRAALREWFGISELKHT